MARVRERINPNDKPSPKTKRPVCEAFGEEIPDRLYKYAMKLAGNESEEKDRARFCTLGWQLLEWKIAYYAPHFIQPDCLRGMEVEDSQFDGCSEEYLALCIKRGWRNTICHSGQLVGYTEGPGMFEVDFSRPCVRLVLSKYGVPGWQKSAQRMKGHENSEVHYCSHCGQPKNLDKVVEPKAKVRERKK